MKGNEKAGYHVINDVLVINHISRFDQHMGIPLELTSMDDGPHPHYSICIGETVDLARGNIQEFRINGKKICVGLTIEVDQFYALADEPLFPLSHLHLQIIEHLPSYAENLKALMERESVSDIEFSFSWID